jgi:hypothetical protein
VIEACQIIWRSRFFLTFFFGLTRKAVANMFLGCLATLCGRNGRGGRGKP